MRRTDTAFLKLAVITAALSTLAACATAAPPPPPPPPPPPAAEIIPLRPLPPGQAAYVMAIPDTFGPAGQRLTVNSNLTEDERTWHFRSAWNVAALNCLDARYQPILDGYSAFISDHARDLKRVNDRIDRTYRDEYSARREAIGARESQMTMVYNFFALPPARAEFCQAALAVSQNYLTAPDIDPTVFAAANFALLERPFENFFQAYEQYEREAAAWDARYGAQYGASQPGYLATQRARARAGELPQPGISDPVLLTSDPVAQETKVVDPDTGAAIPVVPVDETKRSVPVVQPIPSDAGEDDSPQG